jgi:hypothetical protein
MAQCAHCSAEFTPTRSRTQRYCGRGCQRRASAQREAARKALRGPSAWQRKAAERAAAQRRAEAHKQIDSRLAEIVAARIAQYRGS